jgi:hypothetical protein
VRLDMTVKLVAGYIIERLRREALGITTAKRQCIERRETSVVNSGFSLGYTSSGLYAETRATRHAENENQDD